MEPGPLTFLAGGGELGHLIRERDWSQTPLGPAASWPHSLKTAVRIMLTSRQPIWIGWGEELIYLYNDAYKAIIGGKHPAMLGEPTSVVWSEIWDVIEPMLQQAMLGDEGTYVESQLLIMERNGYPEETYYTFSYSPIPDDDGSPGGIICANTDDTRRVIGERQLALLRELGSRSAHTRTWLDAARASVEALETNPRDLPFAVIYLGGPGVDRLVLAGTCGIAPGQSPAFEQIGPDGLWPLDGLACGQVTVVEASRVPGAADWPTGAWDEPPSQVALLPLAASGQTGHGGLLVVGLNPFRHFDESYRNFLTLVAGQISANIAAASAYEGEKRRAEALAEIDRAKTRFFSNVSHEFRTPLTLMLGPVEDMISAGGPALPEAVRSQLELVHRNSLRLLKLVNTMLDFSRIEAGRIQARYEPVDLARYTVELASNFHSACAKAGLELVIECDLPEDAPRTYVDPDMWEKIVLNLMSNAFKFTLDGRIEVRLEAVDGEARLTVSDTGLGVPAAELPRIFDRFHRAVETRGRTHEGTGIGLALVSELVKLHGGTITAQSEVDVGSRFAVIIPLGRAHLDPTRIATAPTRSGMGGARPYVEEAIRWLPQAGAPAAQEIDPPVEDAAAADRARVVWAEDNADMREYVARLLGERFEVVQARDGQDALDRARDMAASGEPPELILSDAMMPRLDGFGLLRAVRADASLREVPVVLLSARAGEEARVEGAEAGADDYLVKPFSARELIARVDAHIRLARARAEMQRAVRRSEEATRTSAQQLRAALELSAIGTWRWDVSGQEIELSPTYRAMLGLPADQPTIRLDRALGLIHPEDRRLVRDQIEAVRQRGAVLSAEFRIRRADSPAESDAYIWLLARGSRMAGGKDGYAAVIGASIDITERRRGEEERAALLAAERQSRLEAEALSTAARALSADLDVQQVVQKTTDLATSLTGAQFGAFFYNHVDGEGESYTLYTISGATREDFERFGLPRNTAIFEPTFRGQHNVRLDDVLADERYGKNAPHHGMPKGDLPVRSYLAIPVRSRSGKVLGGLFFGHAQPGVFTEASERIATAMAAQAAIAMDNAALYDAANREIEHRRKAESLLEAENDALQRIVAGADLSKTLEIVARATEAASPEGLLCSVFLADEDGKTLRPAAAPSLPTGFVAAAAAVPVGPASGSCGTAAFRRAYVEVSDISQSPLWEGAHAIAAEHGLAACHSTPIVSSSGAMLGTIAVYYRRPMPPGARDRLLIEWATNLAGIVIERSRAESMLRESESRFRVMANAAPAVLWVTDPAGSCTFLSKGWYDYTGQNEEDALGLGWLDAVHPDDRERSGQIFLEANARQEPFALDYRIRRADGAYHWAIDTGRPRFDERGEYMGFVGSVIDVHERKRYELALQRSEERMAFVRRSTGVGYWHCDLPFDVLEWDEQVKAHFFVPANAHITINTFYERIHPDDRDRVHQAIERSIRDRDGYDIDYRTVHPKTGQVRWVQAIGRTDYAADGTPRRFDGVTLDVTARVNADEALRGSEKRFRALADNMSQLAWTCDELGSIEWFNRRWLEYTGLPPEKMRGWRWATLLKPDHADRVLKGIEDARRAGEVWEDTFPLRAAGGGYRWFLSRAVPIRDEQGAIINWFGTNTDITERHEHEDQMRTVMAELNHRVKNTLAVVSALAGQTIRRSSSLESFSRSFESRLRSIAKAHSLLTSSEWKGCSLGDIVRNELDSLTIRSPRVTMHGPDITLPPKSCLALHMVMHELTTNATKYGALRDEHGHIEISWDLVERAGDRTVRLEWIETCPLTVHEERNDGFGSRLIQQSVAYDLQGSVEREFTANGLRCGIEFPLPQDRVAGSARSPSETREASPRPGRPSVLVVEDHAAIAMMLCEQVETLGLDVQGPANTLQAAMTLFDQRTPDAALLDVDLHGVRVYPLARRLREQGIPFVLLTGYGVADLPQDLRDEPIFGKPVSSEQVAEFLGFLRG
jgi:PAS domain S-box-containing protein